jgi:hypothetical protein
MTLQPIVSPGSGRLRGKRCWWEERDGRLSVDFDWDGSRLVADLLCYVLGPWPDGDLDREALVAKGRAKAGDVSPVVMPTRHTEDLFAGWWHLIQTLGRCPGRWSGTVKERSAAGTGQLSSGGRTSSYTCRMRPASTGQV